MTKRESVFILNTCAKIASLANELKDVISDEYLPYILQLEKYIIELFIFDVDSRHLLEILKEKKNDKENKND